MISPVVILLLDGSPDLLLVDHLLLGGVLLPLQGAELVEEPDQDDERGSGDISLLTLRSLSSPKLWRC